MATLLIDYATFKTLTTNLTVYYVGPYHDGSIDLFCFPAWGDTNQCLISSAADLADFAATVQPTAVVVESGDAAAAKDNAVNGMRRAVKIQPFSRAGRNYNIVGRRYLATLGTDTNMDLLLTTEFEIQGASVYVQNVTDGDSLDFYAMGPFGPGGALVPVLHWGESIFCKERVRETYQSYDSKTIPAGLTLRIVYHSTGNAGAQPVVIFDMIGWK